MGDDSRDEYIYKYVSNRQWDPRDANRGLAAGDKYLDDGKLYVAQFLPDGSGQWVELKFGINNITPNYPVYAFADQADVLINARHAADAAGATKMDRPEWGAVGDGAATTINNVDGTATQSVTTYVGKTLGEKQLRRFLVGPKECEITGITETPDGKTLFVNIQHPGESTVPNFATGAFGSHWPGGGLTRPRSATIVITRDDGGDVGVD